jgi:hypothetical protein
MRLRKLYRQELLPLLRRNVTTQEETRDELRSLVQSFRPPIQERIERTSQDQSTHDQGEAPPPLAVLRTISQLDPALERKRDADQEKNYRLQRWGVRVQIGLFLATLAAFGAAVWYANIARQQQGSMEGALIQAKRANDLNERLIKGTYGVTFDPEAGFADGILTLIFTNKGKVSSARLEASAKVTPESIPGYVPMREPQSVALSATQIAEGRSASLEKHLEGFTKADTDRMARWKEAISIEGTITYDNGFGDEVSSTFCFLDVRWATGGDGQLIMRPLPCDTAKETVRIGPQMQRAVKDSQKKK